MALSEKERSRIIEEERLRYETRRELCREHGGHRRRWWWWVLLVVGVWWLARLACFGGHGGWGRGCGMHHGGGMGMHGGRCPYHGQAWDKEDGEDDEDEAKAAKPAAPKAPAPKK